MSAAATCLACSWNSQGLRPAVELRAANHADSSAHPVVVRSVEETMSMIVSSRRSVLWSIEHDD